MKDRENKVLLSIAIPTYNRASCLESLLNSIAPQAAEFRGEVEICISNNGSTDNTHEVVANFKDKYPDLIKYSENKENIGFDRNLLKALELAQGKFIWGFGDDDSIAGNGLAQIVDLIRGIDKKNIGMIFVRMDLYFIESKTNKKIFYGSILDKDKPEIFEVEKKDIIGIPFSNPASLSPLIFNGKFLKSTIKENGEIIEKAVVPIFTHIILRSLMFLKYSYLSAIAFNKPIIFMKLSSYKFFVEDKFLLNYRAQKQINNILLSYRYMDNNYAPLIIKRNNRLRWGFIINIIAMKTFKGFHCFSYFGCLKLFFRYATFIDALLFSFVFSFLFLIPTIVLVWLYKILLMARRGRKWRERWFLTSNFNSIINKGTRRQTV